MPTIFKQKLYLMPFTVLVLGVVVVFGLTTRATNDIAVGGTLWTQGLSYWENNITVEPGQTFKISLYASNLSTTNETFTNLRLADQLPQYSNYVIGSSYRLDENGAWQAYPDNGASSPFIAGVVPTSDGSLAPGRVANFKYTLKVNDFLPNGTTRLNWNGPSLNFTDNTGPQTATNVEINTITVQNLPSLQSFTATPSALRYKLGDTINFTLVGTPGKAAKVEIGTTVVPLVGNGTYTGSYMVQTGDNFINIAPRAFLINTNNTGAYLDGSTLTIDGILPPPPTSPTAVLNANTTVTLSWTAPANVSDIDHYNIYSNGGSGDVNYSTPLATVAVGTNQYTTAVLQNDVLYKFAVRSVDAAGNTDGNTNVVSKSTDIIPPEPPASLVQPTNLNSQILKFQTSTPLNFVWTSSPASDLAKYRLEIDDQSNFSSPITTREVNTPTTSLTLTTNDIALPAGIYFWRVFALDDADLVSPPTTTPTNSFEIDNAAPTVTVAQPTNGGFVSGNFTVSGTASDSGTHLNGTNGLQKAEVFLTNLTTGQHWNGTAWTATAAFITVSTSDNFSNWTYQFTAPITNGNSYVTGARVTDKAGNATDSSLINLTGDTALPVVSNVTLTNNTLGSTTIFKNGDNIVLTATITDNLSQSSMTSANIRGYLSAITGSSSDNGVAPASYNSTTGLATWTAVVAADAGDGLKIVGVSATDLADNTGKANSSIMADNTAPTIQTTTLITPSASGIAWASGAVKDITWNSSHISDANLAANPITIEFTANAGLTYDTIAANETNDGLFAWTVPIMNTNLVRVRLKVRDNAGNTAFDESDNNFVIDALPPDIINAVLANSTLGITNLVKNGDTVVLTATITDNYSQLPLSTANITANFTNITNNAGDNAVAPTSYNTSTGATAWSFKTAAGTGNGTLSLSITATDAAGNAATFTNTAIITADNTAPTMPATTLTTPSASGIAWAGGSSQTISWNNSQITDTHLATNPIKLEYTTDGTNHTLIADNEANDGSFAWLTPGINSQTVRVRITARDNVALTSSDSSDNNFTIDSTPPTVPSNALTAPNGGEAWKQGTVRTITWNSGAITDNFTLAANPISLSYSFTSSGPCGSPSSGGGGGGGGGSSSQGSEGIGSSPGGSGPGCSGFSAAALIASNEANDGSFNWTTPMDDYTTFKVKITATDAAGNTAFDESDNTFSIGLPPTIVQARAVGNTTIEVEWNKALASAGPFGNYTATAITTTAAAVSGTNNKIVLLTVNALNNTGFTASDLAVAANTVTDTSNFQNEAASGVSIVDKQTPTISLANSYPNSNQLIVDLAPAMRISVSEAFGTTTAFKLDTVSQTISYDSVNKMITFTPLSALAAGKHSLSLDMIDVAGNAAANQIWDFYIDNFGVSIITAPVSLSYNGNNSDETSAGERQQITVSTFGAGYKIYALFQPDFGDGFGNFITDVDAKLAALSWTNKIDLNRTTPVQLVSVAKAGTPGASIVNTTYTYDLRAAISGVLQPAGNYSGTLQFIVVPEY